MKLLKKLEPVLNFSVLISVLVGMYLVFMHVPNERVMGPVQRIFYFHVGSAIACYLAFAVVLVGSLGYLATRKVVFDQLSYAAGEVGFIFCTLVLATGMIWGKAAWNTIFRWEPRLVSFLILWLIFLAFNLLRYFGDRSRVRQHSAVLGILGACTVPLVVFSIKLLPQFAQLHPQVVENRGLKDSSYIFSMFFCMATLVLFTLQLVWIRFRIAFLEEKKYGTGA